MSKSANGKTHSKVGTGGEGKNRNDGPVHTRYPVLSSWEFVLSNTSEPVSGTIYCTDEATQTIMLIPSSSLSDEQSSSVTEVRILNTTCIVKSTKIGDPSPSDVESLVLPSTPMHKKTLEDRERRAIRQAEEIFRNINEKVSHKRKADCLHL